MLLADRAHGMLARAGRDVARVVTDAARPPFRDHAFDVVVLTFMLFHLPDPVGSLTAVRDLLAPGGAVGLTVWGRPSTAPARSVLDDEIARAGVPEAEAVVAQHDLMDTHEKLRSLLTGAGYADVVVESVGWSHQASCEEFLRQHAVLGVTGRRLALLVPEARDRLLERARDRLIRLPPQDFLDTSEVLAATALAP